MTVPFAPKTWVDYQEGPYLEAAELNRLEDAIDALAKAVSFASIYASSPAAAQSIPSGLTYTKVTPFSANVPGNVGSTPDHANDRITVDRAGTYRVSFSRSYSVNSANDDWHVAIFVDGAKAPQSEQMIRVVSSSQSYYASMSCHIVCEAGDAIDVRVYHSNGVSVDLTYQHAVLSVEAIDVTD